ncbi:MAG: DUF1351 domain-containing protein [Campylobacter ureolyticus]|uniref:DUF1351 domain-containing protein n=1 Tax=Campylobacter ureolyticus TaxID=827 RepID=UPI0022B3BEBC|nr:DUF1351 domain-containing protein [Campylobacter ureolyticus]MCZ6102886.1 DUF1351 domain-containing protein [Campylobacter ureolyticus]MDU4981101.1 DUF1351 domain-containing protein [Campylobacter ureolyticus]
MNELNLVVLGEVSNISTNFNEIKDYVANQVAKYSIEVTEENIPEAKKVMANFNKVKAEISSKYKEYIDDLSAPINKLKNEKKEIEQILTDGRQKIADEVADFEKEKLKIISKTISEYICDICNEKNISPDLIGLDEFLKLSSVTTNGTITKATKDAIDAKVSLVENEILKAKLEAEQKERERREIAEKARIEAEERAIREKAEYEARAEKEKQEVLARAEREKQEALEKAEKEKKEEIEKARIEAFKKQEIPKFKVKKTNDGKNIYTVRATFEVKCKSEVSHESIKNQLANILKRAGISTCLNIEVLND